MDYDNYIKVFIPLAKAKKFLEESPDFVEEMDRTFDIHKTMISEVEDLTDSERQHLLDMVDAEKTKFMTLDRTGRLEKYLKRSHWLIRGLFFIMNRYALSVPFEGRQLAIDAPMPDEYKKLQFFLIPLVSYAFNSLTEEQKRMDYEKSGVDKEGDNLFIKAVNDWKDKYWKKEEAESALSSDGTTSKNS